MKNGSKYVSNKYRIKLERILNPTDFDILTFQYIIYRKNGKMIYSARVFVEPEGIYDIEFIGPISKTKTKNIPFIKSYVEKYIFENIQSDVNASQLSNIDNNVIVQLPAVRWIET